MGGKLDNKIFIVNVASMHLSDLLKAHGPTSPGGLWIELLWGDGVMCTSMVCDAYFSFSKISQLY